jgi:hydroxyacylglutathione hydrolase
MQILQVYMQNALRNFNYILYAQTSSDALFVDPLNIDLTLPHCHSLGLRPRYLMNTHEHADHIYHNQRLIAQEKVEVLKLTDQERFYLTIEDYIQAIDTPGHVHDHQCFLVFSQKKPFALISGDALFNAGVGNCKNGGNVEEHYFSIKKLSSLPDDILIYPSHDYLLNNLKFAQTIEPENAEIQSLIKKREKQDLEREFIVTNLALEKKINPFLRLNSDGVSRMFPALDEKERFRELRKLRDQW